MAKRNADEDALMRAGGLMLSRMGQTPAGRQVLDGLKQDPQARGAMRAINEAFAKRDDK